MTGRVSTFTLYSSSRIIRCGQHVLKTPGHAVFAPQEAGRRAGTSLQEQKSEAGEITMWLHNGKRI